MSPTENIVINFIRQYPGSDSLQITRFTNANYGFIRGVLANLVFQKKIKSKREGKKNKYFVI